MLLGGPLQVVKTGCGLECFGRPGRKKVLSTESIQNGGWEPTRGPGRISFAKGFVRACHFGTERGAARFLRARASERPVLRGRPPEAAGLEDRP
jgi:hypothetical protein